MKFKSSMYLKRGYLIGTLYLTFILASCGRSVEVQQQTPAPSNNSAEEQQVVESPEANAPAESPVAQPSPTPNNPGVGDSGETAPPPPGNQVPTCDQKCLSEVIYDYLKSVVDQALIDVIETQVPEKYQIPARMVAINLSKKTVKKVSDELAKVLYKQKLWPVVENIANGDFDFGFIEDLISDYVGIEVDGLIDMILEEVLGKLD